MRFDSNGKYISPTEKDGEKAIDSILSDAAKIAQYLGTTVPEIRTSSSRTGGFYHLKLHYIFLGVKGGYRRTALVHEMLHHSGLRHKTGFRSNLRRDSLSPQIEVKIFGEKRDLSKPLTSP